MKPLVYCIVDRIYSECHDNLSTLTAFILNKPSSLLYVFFFFYQFGQYKGDGKGGVIGSLSNILTLLMDRIKWEHNITTNTYYTLVNMFWQMVINMSVLFITGGMVFLVCTKAWRQSCYRRYWQLPSCLLYMRRSLLLPSKSWALTGNWSSEHTSTWIQYYISSSRFW